jgi:hypothetical protein
LSDSAPSYWSYGACRSINLPVPQLPRCTNSQLPARPAISPMSSLPIVPGSSYRAKQRAAISSRGTSRLIVNGREGHSDLARMDVSSIQVMPGMVTAHACDATITLVYGGFLISSHPVAIGDCGGVVVVQRPLSHPGATLHRLRRTPCIESGHSILGQWQARDVAPDSVAGLVTLFSSHVPNQKSGLLAIVTLSLL